MFSWPSHNERMCRTWGLNLGPLACQANMLPIELPRPAPRNLQKKWAAAWQNQQNKWPVRPANSYQPDQSSLSAWRYLGYISTRGAQSKDWSDRADAQADLRVCWATVMLLVLSCCGSNACACRFRFSHVQFNQNELVHTKTYKITCAPCKDSDQTAHLWSVFPALGPLLPGAHHSLGFSMFKWFVWNTF